MNIQKIRWNPSGRRRKQENTRENDADRCDHITHNRSRLRVLMEVDALDQNMGDDWPRNAVAMLKSRSQNSEE